MRRKIRAILEEVQDDTYEDFWEAMWSGNSIKYKDVLERYIPQLKFMKGLDQNPVHHPEGDVDVHVYLVIDNVAQYKDKDISLGALFHDIGKIDTKGLNDKTGHSNYLGHEKVSGKYVKYYKDLIEDSGGSYYIVKDLVANHMQFHRKKQMKPSNVEHMESKGHYDKLEKLCNADHMVRK